MRAIGKAAGALALLLFVGAAWAGEPPPEESGYLDGTAHDLRGRLSIDRLCLPCHVAHNAPEADAGPIWNHAVTEQTFYREGEEITLGANSKLCMSCHDGVTAVDSYGGTIGSDTITGGADLGNDFSNDHPVGIDYPADSHILEAPGDVAAYLDDGKVECTSCHYAHGGQDNKFLRVTYSGSQICRVCHVF